MLHYVMTDEFLDVQDTLVRKSARRGRLIFLNIMIVYLIPNFISFSILFFGVALVFFLLAFAGYRWARITVALLSLVPGIIALIGMIIEGPSSMANRIYINFLILLCLVTSGMLFCYSPIRVFQEVKRKRRETE